MGESKQAVSTHTHERTNHLGRKPNSLSTQLFEHERRGPAGSEEEGAVQKERKKGIKEEKKGRKKNWKEL